MTEIPIACTLTSEEQTSRGEEWRQFLVDDVVEVIRSGTAVHMKLKGGDDAILNAVDLARREKACCAFFEFRLELLADVVWLEVWAPAEAAALLDALTETVTA